ncbi:hypothetical protein [Shewanella sp. YLB-07]|nr:hypothetical protein [Shewanella sp. YLB-07]
MRKKFWGYASDEVLDNEGLILKSIALILYTPAMRLTHSRLKISRG